MIPLHHFSAKVKPWTQLLLLPQLQLVHYLWFVQMTVFLLRTLRNIQSYHFLWFREYGWDKRLNYLTDACQLRFFGCFAKVTHFYRTFLHSQRNYLSNLRFQRNFLIYLSSMLKLLTLTTLIQNHWHLFLLQRNMITPRSPTKSNKIGQSSTKFHLLGFLKVLELH